MATPILIYFCRALASRVPMTTHPFFRKVREKRVGHPSLYVRFLGAGRPGHPSLVPQKLRYDRGPKSDDGEKAAKPCILSSTCLLRYLVSN